ncbi:MAG: NADH-quinone oxidoreductase subunit NuoK [Deltaproteobacteria bacterium]|nr:NADH-quinone oxidoreductase subunit NuoK [Deltaproteobacteria bacterium]
MTLEIWLLFAAVLFAFGIYAVVARRNLIAVLIGVELMLNAASLNFMAFNRFVATDPATGQIIVLFIMGLAAAEVAIALSIVVQVFRSRGGIRTDDLNELKG